jgi:hypothetical protein
MKAIRTLTVSAAAFALVALIGSAHAQYTTSHIGGFDYTNGPNGYSATQSHVGGFTYGNDNMGNSWTTSHVGGFDYTTVTPGYRNCTFGC